ncbi:MAG: dGTP triphosphohydrolase, partial [Candidatus Zixiibacteriota bacterium]
MNKNSLTREDIERREQKILAPYAALSSQSRGRVYPLKEHPLRTAFQRDRDRIIHSTAFRRMEYKTQVFIPHETDHYRTRLTHTIEVAQISRTMARNLRLNEDLAEAIALVHDLGHTPFGHSGEEVLDELLNEYGGFNHNRQSLRVVDYLEHRYNEYPGLNLTYEVR